MSFMSPNYVDSILIQPRSKNKRQDWLHTIQIKAVDHKRTFISTHRNKKKLQIIVVHENRGLNPYIEDVGHREQLKDYYASARCFISIRWLSW
jgi:carboxymethylenebutenolidase